MFATLVCEFKIQLQDPHIWQYFCKNVGNQVDNYSDWKRSEIRKTLKMVGECCGIIVSTLPLSF